jgi:hypothetical protein
MPEIIDNYGAIFEKDIAMHSRLFTKFLHIILYGN